MTRVAFTLTMPSRRTWNSAWSGDGKNYTIVREVGDTFAAEIDGRSWSYSWNDGWRASVIAHIVPIGASLAKSDGFCGYDWMVDSVIRYGKIYADHERPEKMAP